MKKMWKQILAAGCAVTMLMTMPGMRVLADEIVDEAIATVAEDPYPTVDVADALNEAETGIEVPAEEISVEEDIAIEAESVDQENPEEIVGFKIATVGNRVTATFDSDTGSVELTSQGGELWRDWVEKLGIDRYSIKSIKVISGTVYLPANSRGYYYDNGYIDYYFFCCLPNLTSLDLSGFNTSNVTNMKYMFYGCYNLTELDLSVIDTSKVTDMEYMFWGCTNLKKVDFQRINTSDVQIMDYMFSDCKSLTDLDLSSFNTSNVNDMYAMFSGCENLKSLDLRSFNTSKVTNMSGMFSGCKSLNYLDLSNFNTTNVTSMGGMFSGCSSLKSLDLRCFNTSNVTNMMCMFLSCNSLTSLRLDSFDTSNVTDMRSMFGQCSSLTSLDLSSFKTSNVKIMGLYVNWLDEHACGMFSGCSSLKSLNLRSFDTSNVEYMYELFYGCSSLTSLDLSGFNTPNLIDMRRMFYGCSSLKNLDLRCFDTSHITDMSYMFFKCSNLASVDLSSFDTSNVTNMADMFSGCTSLTNIDLRNFDTSNARDMGYMFNNCSSLTSLDLSCFDASNTTYLSGIVNYCTNLQLLQTPNNIKCISYLPFIMYDEFGNAYEQLTNISDSIILTRERPKNVIPGCIITLSENSYTYDGSAKLPTATVKDDTVTLIAGIDYIISYADNTNAGTATVKITGTGAYKGWSTVTFTIKKADAILFFEDANIFKKITDTSFMNMLTKTTDGIVTFSSSDTRVADVSSTSGLVTIKGAGTATITASAAEGTNYKTGSASYALTVEVPAPTPAATSFSDVQDPTHPYYKAIYWAADAGITKGYADGTFGINRSCTRGEMMMFLWRYAGKPSPKTVSKSPFKDVPKTHTFYKAILWGSQKGITKGYSDGTFGINRNVSRGECMMFLWRLKGKPAPTPVVKSPFKDVPKTHAFYNAILWGAQKKVTTGYTSGVKKGTFGINENCTRGQIVTFLYRAK